MELSKIADVLGGEQVLGRRLESEMDFVELGNQGVPKEAVLNLKKYLSLPCKQTENLLPITVRTIQRYSLKQRLTPIVSEQVLHVARVLAAGVSTNCPKWSEPGCALTETEQTRIKKAPNKKNHFIGCSLLTLFKYKINTIVESPIHGKGIISDIRINQEKRASYWIEYENQSLGETEYGLEIEGVKADESPYEIDFKYEPDDIVFDKDLGVKGRIAFININDFHYILLLDLPKRFNPMLNTLIEYNARPIMPNGGTASRTA